MENVYILNDAAIFSRIGNHLRQARLKQNITQQSLADAANVSLSSIRKIENGKIGSFDALVRIMRILGMLEVLQPLIDEEQMSPNEYYDLVNSSKKRQRKRAVGKIDNANKEDSEW